VLVNGDMGPDEAQAFCKLDEQSRQLIKAASQQLELSACAYHRVLKLAGSPSGAIADLAGEESIRPLDLAEAFQYWPRNLV
jgi:magnesium chelatase family protein